MAGGGERDDMTETIRSERLDLISMTPEFLRASLARDGREAARLLRLRLPAGWPAGDADVLALRLVQLERDPALQPWLLRAIAHRGTGTVVGHIGFHAAPGSENLRPYSARGVEFGFTVFPGFRRRGIAREASLALMDWARQAQDGTEFFLTIRPDNAASQALAAGLGFVRVGSQMDEVDGLEDVLAYRADDRGSAAR